jgi:eukaryotic-like serine/threonine-protein kinase
MISLPDQGERLGKYELVTVLAKSPLGPTWLARSIDASDASPIVVAVRRLTLGSALAKADKDVLAQAAVWALSETSEGALNSLDIVVTGHELGLVREHAIGQPLRTLLRRCTLNAQTVPSTVVLRLALDVLETLSAPAAREHRLASGVSVHCGLLGPDFLWVTSDGRTLLTDIGVSSALRAAAPFGGLADLVSYSAPEQLSGTLDDPRSDVFVLGVMLWELLSGGRRLFPGSDPSTVAAAVNSAHIVAPIASDSTPSEVESFASPIVMRALDRDVNQRYQTPAQMRQAILDLAPSAVASRQEVASLIAILSGGELAAQDEAVRRALGHGSSQRADAAAEARRSAAPSSTVPRLSSADGASPVSSPPPKPASSPLSSPPSKPAPSPASEPSARVDGPTSAVPDSIPPQTDEVDSAWGEEPGSADAGSAAASSTAVRSEKPSSPAAAPPALADAPTPAAASAQQSAERVAPTIEAAPSTPSPAPPTDGARSANVHASGATRKRGANDAVAGRVVTLASAGSAPSYGAVSLSDSRAQDIATQPGRGARWQIAATASFLGLAGLFAIIALMRKPVAHEPNPVAGVAGPTTTVSAAAAGPSAPTGSLSESPALSAPTAAEGARDQVRTEDAGSTGGAQEERSFAAALSKRLSSSASTAHNEPVKKGKGAQPAKGGGSADNANPLDVLRRLESRRREKKEAKTSAP